MSSAIIQRLVYTFLAAVFYYSYKFVYLPQFFSYQARAAARQLADTPDSAMYRALSGWSFPEGYITLGVSILLLVIWYKPLRRLVLQYWKRYGKRVMALFSLLVMALSLTACYEPEHLVVIAPNETAFLIPLEGQNKNDQAKFGSEEYLNEKKVATKRVTIPTRERQLGGFTHQHIETAALVKVNRAPVVREWTSSATTGSTPKNQAFKVESTESIDFWIGAVASASIREEDAAKFLYYFNGKQLEEVMDQNVRGFVQKQLFEEFGSLPLEKARLEKKNIFQRVEESAKSFFMSQGITIGYIGGTEGMTYTDPKIQEAINANFSAQQQVEQASQQALAQAERNKAIVSQGEAEAAALRARADAAKSQGGVSLELEIARINAERDIEVAKLFVSKYKGDTPSTVVVSGDNSNGMPPTLQALAGQQLSSGQKKP